MNSLIIKLSRFIGNLNFIRRSIRFRIFNKLKQDYEFEVNYFNYKYEGNLNNYVDRSVFFFGAHEREQLVFSKRYINNSTIIDCGANTGSHSLFYSRYGKYVVSIEPNEDKILELKNRIYLNNISNITLLHCGVGSENNQSMPFYQATGDNEGISSFINNFSPENQYIKNVVIRTLDNIVGELRIFRVDFIKIDVEGFDYEVLKGSKETILRDRPIIQIEYHPRDLEKMNDFLSSNYNYTPKSLIVNRPFFVFNKNRGKLQTFDPKLRCEVFLFPNKFFITKLNT